MRRRGIHHLVVVDRHAVVGVLTLDEAERRLAEDVSTVGNAMYRHVRLGTPEMPVAEAAALLRGRIEGALPVVDGRALVGPLELRPPAGVQLGPPRLVEGQHMRVVGLAERCSFETTITIPAQWQRFMERYDAIPFKRDEIPIGVTFSADDDGQFFYMCGAEVDDFGKTSAELLQLEIPPQRYAVFEHRGHVSTIFETYRSIWNDAMPATGQAVADAPIIERHNPTFDPRTGEGGLTLWIPVAAGARRASA